MSVSLKESYDIAYDGSENAARMDLFIDTSADLAGLTHFDSIKLLQGSTAEDISTGDKYMMQTGGTWVLQPSSNVFSNVYTKAEIDAIIANYYTSAQTDEYYQWVIVTIDTDVLPLAFLSDGTPLTAWSISGNMARTGTPTPTVPITPEECGELVTTGEHAGQYAIPISNGNTTYNIFLNEPLRKFGDYGDTVASDGTVVRRIKKLVLTGQEAAITKNDATTNTLFYIRFENNNWTNAIMAQKAICTHLKYQAYVEESVYIGYNGVILYLNFGTDIMNAQTSGNTVDGLKEYLAAQYAAGTPVCIWYVLSTPTTETFTAPQIVPAKGANTLTVNTTLPPSEVSITGGIREGV